MNKIDRYKILIRHLINSGIIKNQKELGRQLGYSNESSFSQVINGKVPEPKDFILKLKLIVPDLNIKWLDTGEGDMILNSPGTIAHSITATASNHSTATNHINGDAKDFIKLLEKKDEQMDRLISVIEKLTDKQ